MKNTYPYYAIACDRCSSQAMILLTITWSHSTLHPRAFALGFGRLQHDNIMSNPVATVYSTTNAAVLLAFLQLHIYMCELVRSLKPWGTRPSSRTKKKSSNQNLHNAAQTLKVRQCTSILPFRESILRKTAWTPPICFLVRRWPMDWRRATGCVVAY